MTDDDKKKEANPPQPPQGVLPTVAPAITIPEPLEVRSLEDYIKMIYAPHSELGEGALWYRGDSDAGRSLMPSIFRLLENEVSRVWNPTSEEINECRWQEYQANHRFLRLAKAIDKDFPDDSDRVSQLVVMRHHGLRSRLLDWTASPLVALLFAVVKGVIKSETGSCVWILAPYRLKNKFGIPGTGVLPWNADPLPQMAKCAFDDNQSESGKILPFIPQYSMPRHVAQKSMFTMHSSHQPLNHFPDSGNFLRKIIIPQGCQRNIYVELSNAGITWDLLFPDLDGVAKWVNIHTERRFKEKKAELVRKKQPPPAPGDGD